jgi:hypothetical protein
MHGVDEALTGLSFGANTEHKQKDSAVNMRCGKETNDVNGLGGRTAPAV